MDSVMMPQEGPPLDDYKADPSPVSVDKDEPPQKKPNIRKRTKTGCLSIASPPPFPKTTFSLSSLVIVDCLAKADLTTSMPKTSHQV